MGREMWDRFRYGEWARVAEESHAQREYQSRKQADGVTSVKAMEYLRDNPSRLYFDEDGDMWYFSLPSWSIKEDPEGEWLVLTLRTRSGNGRYAPDHKLRQPPGWKPPYGITFA